MRLASDHPSGDRWRPSPGVRSRPGRVQLLPLATLGFTTILLAASAIRVVSSAIVEPTSTRPTAGASVSAPPSCLDKAPIALALPLPEVDDPAPPSPVERIASSPPPPRPSPTLVHQATHPSPVPPSPPRDEPKPSPAIKKGVPHTSPRVPATPASPAALPPAPASVAKKVLVRDPAGGPPIVTRVLGQDGDRTAVLMPDGEVGWPDGLAYTERPFVPATKDEIKLSLLSREFAGFQTIETRHYLILYQGSKAHAQNSAAWLENLYGKVGNAFNRRDVPVHEAEFPLVAVIFKTEDDFRRRKRVSPDVQAYYELQSNRIFLYESSRKDETAPEVTALRKPQTVAHEGTHQILQNIGVQPRMSNWPLWLVEGLAEYCASPRIAKNGVPTWDGLNQVNLLHMATIRDLDDPLSNKVPGANVPAIGRDKGQPLVEYLITRSDLTPTDYALAWALTYHLANKRLDEFLDYLRELSRIAPLEKRTPEDHLRSFKAAFGDNLAKLDIAVGNHLRKLKQVDALPYYAVVFEQPLGGGVIRRAAMVSQSPSMIRQWIETSTSPRGAEPRWQVFPHPTKARALLAAEEYMGNGSG